MPRILNLAISGWHRLKKRGYFQQPKSSEDVVEQFEDISSPVKQFVRERCALGADYHVTRNALFDAWCAWCKAEGRDHPGTKATFGKDLSAAFPELKPKRVGSRGEQVHSYAGIKLVTVSGIPKGVFIFGVDFNENPTPIRGAPVMSAWVKQRDAA